MVFEKTAGKRLQRLPQGWPKATSKYQGEKDRAKILRK